MVPDGHGRDEPSWLRWALHPFLLAPLPAWELWAENIAYVTVRDAVPIIVTLVLVAGGIVLLALRRTDPRRAAMVATSLLLWFGLYGVLVPATAPVLPAVVGWTGLLAAVLWMTARLSRRWLGPATAMLNSAGVVLLLLNGSAIVAHSLVADAAPVATTSLAQVGSAASQPDVWYVIPDRYGRADLMADQWGVDNSAFVAALRDRGFTVVDDAWANYSNTDMSLASAWSLDHLEVDGRTSDEVNRQANRLLDDPPIAGLFADFGYEYVHLGSWTRPTASPASADRVLTLEDTNEFRAAWEDVTVLSAVRELLGDAGLRSHSWQRQLDHARHQLATLEDLAREETDRPRFVVAHLLLPHPPYVFHEDGTVRPFRRAEHVGALAGQEEQLRFLNDRLLDWFDTLERHDPGAVVAIVADEGPYPDAVPVGDPRLWDWESMTLDDERIKMGILAAVRLSGTPPPDIGQTPVNLLRTLVNDTLGTDLPALPERAWRRGGPRGERLVEITDRLGLD